MKIKNLLLIVAITANIYAGECDKKYDVSGCSESSFDLESELLFALEGEMIIRQYKVIYDEDQDGVRDSLDKCSNTPLKTKVDKDGCHTIVVEEKIIEEIVEKKEIRVVTLEVNFETNKFNILPSYNTVIEEFANFLIEYPSYHAKIIGHTDSIGNYSKNIQLSRNRASTINDALIVLGLDTKRLSFEGVGPNEPIATNSTKDGRTQNRRIEVTLTKENN